MSKWEARNKGLIWSRRKGADNRLEFKDKLTIENQEEKESREKLKRKLSETKIQLGKCKRLQSPDSDEVTGFSTEEIDNSFDSDLYHYLPSYFLSLYKFTLPFSVLKYSLHRMYHSK